MTKLIAMSLLTLLATAPVSAQEAAASASATAEPAAAEASAGPQVTVDTSKGTIVIELFPDKAPKTVENFLSYVNAGFYDGTIFHRVIPGFMIQGGGFSPDMKKKQTRAAIQNEADNGLKNDRGTLAMARTGNPNSATAQFFINSINNDFLNHTAKTPRGWGYAVFARVVEGMDVVDAISEVPTGQKNRMRDVPQEPVVIKKATVKK
ncbi:MAG: peptidylprolyl isomerase [Acidobacteriota bacterium]